MQITETVAEGLKRELKIVIGADELDRHLTERLEELKNQVQLKGFRPGKVPLSHMRRTFGKRVMPEVVEKVVQETSQQALSDRQERPALQPSIKLSEDADEIAGIIDGKSDLAFTMAFEVIPPIEPTEFTKIEITRPVTEVQDSDIDEALDSLRKQQRKFEPRDEGAASEAGDRVTIDFVGRVDGEEFEGGAGEDAQLELGSGQFIPGFEDQLTGVKAGDKVDVKVTFPDEYGAENLAGKDAVFDVTVKEVAAPVDVAIDDDLAKALGMEDLEALRNAVKSQIEADYTRISRSKVKRRLLDALDEAHSFELPQGLVDSEFDAIWESVKRDQSGGDDTPDGDEKKAEDTDDADDDADKAEYRTIAERRVRLGLVLADVGEQNGITVTEDELNRAVMERVRQFPGQEAEALKFYRSNLQAMAELRAPIFEDKVVDFVLELAKVTDEPVSREELMAEDDVEEASEPAKMAKADKGAKADEAKSAKKPAARKKKTATKS